ncbi:MAG: rhomboid family intramembrane serine protease [Treponema sp.]|jgi:membrane associated rhomboid family serine protease|nr:rhomboid family intramembrane serine protease [Treponema sp.]
MKIKYNAPTTLTFAFVCAAVLILNQTILRGISQSWFAVGPRGSFSAANARCWITLFTHVIGHADWNHLISNFSLILLIGPILEANYGSRGLFLMIVLTALITGILNVLIFPSYLMGASGVVFMMILLASFTNFSEGEIPLTFILILILYIGREVFNSFRQDNISEFAHIVGGLCGSLFGFFGPSKKGRL